jgi:hypothetical protein
MLHQGTVEPAIPAVAYARQTACSMLQLYTQAHCIACCSGVLQTSHDLFQPSKAHIINRIDACRSYLLHFDKGLVAAAKAIADRWTDPEERSRYQQLAQQVRSVTTFSCC